MTAAVLGPAARMRPATIDRVLLGIAVAVTIAIAAGLATLAVAQRMLMRDAPRYADNAWDDVVGTAYVAAVIALCVVVVVRQRRHAVGWLLLALFSCELIVDATAAVALVGLHDPAHRFGAAAGWAAVSESANRPEFGIALAILLVFPTGHVPGPRWRPLLWALVALFALWFLDHLLRPEPLEENPFAGVHNPFGQSWAGNAVLHYGFLPSGGVLAIGVLASMVVRFRRSSGDERQQLRWLLALGAGLPLCLVGLGIGALIGPKAMSLAGDGVWIFLAFGLPVAIVIAITRYRLYDLDLLMNRTVVYGALTAVLVATYVLIVLLATRVAVGVGVTSPVLVALATLAAAAVAAPARAGIQHGVDRVFQRRSFDARRRVEAFAATSRTTPLPPSALQSLLAELVGDPTAQLGFRVRGHDEYRDTAGAVLAVPAPGRVALPIQAHGEPVAVLLADAAVARDRRLLSTVADAASLVTENARLQAEVLTQLAEVQASRARIVDAADAERRRVERDLHDGAQQRLVALAMRVKLAARTAPASSAGVLAQIEDELRTATRELRELARGIHPASLDEGLDAALETLTARLPMHVRVDVDLPRRCAATELTAYYLAAEAITNAAKHADAARIDVTAHQRDGRLVVTVRDDGCGGADATRGSGLAGLHDRAAAAGGAVTVDSPPGHGTTIVASLPCDC